MSERLLKHFDLLATAPDGVAKLRELILTLAVQGKLVPQDPNDEPASVLLERIRAEKERLVAEEKIKRDKPLPPITDEEKPFELPPGWEFCRLGDLLLSIRSGGTPSKQNPAYWDGDIPWASVKDLGFGDPITDTKDRITVEGLQAGSQLAPAGSILICTRMGLGKIGEALIDVAINQDLKAVQLGPGVDKGHFVNFFKTLSLVGSGMTVAGIKQDELLSFVVPLPPTAEQSRIVARVEELMRLCDALEAKRQLDATQHAQLLHTLLGKLTDSATPEELATHWQRVAAHFDLLLDRPEAVDALEQTILQLAVRGLLVPQDPTDEPASVLLQRIRAEKDRLIAEGKIKRDKPLPPITDEEKPFELPKGWEWVRLNALLQKIGAGSTPLGGKEVYVSSGVKFLRSQNIWNDGLRLDGVAYIELETHAKMAGTVVLANDLLFNITGASIGRCAPVPADFDEANVSQHVTIIRTVMAALNPFLHKVLVSRHVQQTVMDVQVGVSREGLSIAKLGQFLIPVPPLAEQSRIVARVEELRQLCNELRQRLNASRTAQGHLAEALVDEAA